MKAEAQLLKGHLDTLLLATLETGPLHGYAVMEALRQAGGSRFDLPTGTIYPALRRLETAGLLDGNWSVVGPPPPPPSPPPPAGRRKLSGDRATWRDFAPTV